MAPLRPWLQFVLLYGRGTCSRTEKAWELTRGESPSAHRHRANAACWCTRSITSASIAPHRTSRAPLKKPNSLNGLLNCRDRVIHLNAAHSTGWGGDCIWDSLCTVGKYLWREENKMDTARKNWIMKLWLEVSEGQTDEMSRTLCASTEMENDTNAIKALLRGRECQAYCSAVNA